MGFGLTAGHFVVARVCAVLAGQRFADPVAGAEAGAPVTRAAKSSKVTSSAARARPGREVVISVCTALRTRART